MSVYLVWAWLASLCFDGFVSTVVDTSIDTLGETSEYLTTGSSQNAAASFDGHIALTI